MPDKFVVPDNNTEPDLDGETDIEYIFTSDKVKGDPRGLTGLFSLSGKINVVLQKIVNALAWMRKAIPKKATQEQAEAGTDNDRFLTASTSQAQLQHSEAQATETQRGTVKKATQKERRAATDNEKYMTPLGTKDYFENATSPATLSVSSGTITIRNNILLGRLLFIRAENTGSKAIPSSVTWTLGGGNWRIFSVSRYREINESLYDTGGAGYQLSHVLYDSNSTTFRYATAEIEVNDELNIIAIKV